MYTPTLNRELGAEFEALRTLWLDPAVTPAVRPVRLRLRQRLERWKQRCSPFRFEVDLRGLLAL